MNLIQSKYLIRRLSDFVKIIAGSSNNLDTVSSRCQIHTMKIHCFVSRMSEHESVMSRVLVICACKSNIFFINRARERSIESGWSAYILYIYIKDANFPPQTDSPCNRRTRFRTKQWITYYVEDYLSIPFNNAKSLGSTLIRMITISAIIICFLIINQRIYWSISYTTSITNTYDSF